MIQNMAENVNNIEWKAVPFKYLKDVVKSGRVLFHETTRENEFEILLSMATDNPKEQLLGQFWEAKNWNFLPSRVFKTRSGNPIKPKVLKALRMGVYNRFKNSATRRGERQVRRGMTGMTMEDVFEESNRMRTIYFDIDGNVRPVEEIQKLLTHEFEVNTPDVKIYMGKDVGEMLVQWQDVSVNSHIAAVEHIIATPQLMMDANPLIEKESIAGSPLRFERWMYNDAHVYAVKNLNKLLEDKINKYMETPEKAAEVGQGSIFIEKMAKEFEDLLYKLGRNRESAEGIKYEYSAEFQEFIEKWLPQWNKLSPRAQSWATIKFLAGTAKKNKKGKDTSVAFRLKLLPIQLMSPNIIKSYAKLFHKRLVGPVKDKQQLKPGDAKYKFQFKRFEEIAERVCG